MTDPTPVPLGEIELRAALEAIADLCEMMAEASLVSIFPEPPEDQRAKDSIAAEVMRNVACLKFTEAATIARDALGRYPKEAR